MINHQDPCDVQTTGTCTCNDIPAPVLTLIAEAEIRHGSMYCKVTTYELRVALGMNTDNWPTLDRA